MKKLLPLLSVIFILCFALPAQDSSGQPYEPPFLARIRLLPGYGLPLGDSQYLFRYAAGGELSFHYRPSELPFLNLFLNAGYSTMPIKDNSTMVSLPSLGAGAGIEFEIVNRTFLEAFIWGGYWHGIVHTDGYDGGNPYLSEAVSIAYDVTPKLRLGAGGGYRNYFGLHSDAFFFANATLRFDFHLEDPYLPEFPEIEPVYPLLANYYAEGNAIGLLELSNDGSAPVVEPRIRLSIDGATVSGVESPAPGEVTSGSTHLVPLLITLRERSTELPAEVRSARVEAGYRYRGWPKNLSTAGETRIIRIEEWEDPATIALFIAPQQKDIAAAAERIVEDTRYRVADEINRNLQLAAACFDSLAQKGIDHIESSTRSYSGFRGAEAIDYFPHPQTVLQAGKGDDADLAILYCSLLESAGVTTAVLRSGERLFAAIDLETGVSAAAAKYAHMEDLVPRGDSVWAAVDFARIGDGFLAALASAAENVNRNGIADFTILRNAWRAYPPTGYLQPARGLSLPSGKPLLDDFLETMNRVVDWEIEARRDRLLSAIERNRKDPELLNSLGALLAKYGDLESGEEYLKQALLVEENSSILVNLGNIYFLRRSLRQARSYYDKAARIDPFNPYVLLGQARVSFELENFGDAADAYSRLETVDSDLADRFGILKTASAAAAEEARTGELRRLVFWLEE